MPGLEPRSAGAGLSSEGLRRLYERIESSISDGEIAGCVILVARHGVIAAHHAMGMRDIASHDVLRTDTIFRIFSMTKPVTGVAMMMLHDEGLWSPGDAIAEHLPEFANVNVFAGLDANGDVMVVPPAHAPTMGELMTHTAGLSYGLGFNPADTVDRLYQAANVWRSSSLREMAAKIAALPLAYQPGSRWSYSLSTDVQGAIIEKLSGLPLPTFMRERIFAPLGMPDTGFHVPPDKVSRLATLYRYVSAKLVVTSPLFPPYEEPPAVASGGAGLVSTAADYGRFAQMLLNGGELDGVRIVSASSLKLQMSNQLPGSLLAGGLGYQRLRPGFGYGFGGAVYFDPASAGSRVGRGTYQWDGAFGTWFWVDPEHDLLCVGMIQRGPADFPDFQSTTQELLANAIIA